MAGAVFMALADAEGGGLHHAPGSHPRQRLRSRHAAAAAHRGLLPATLAQQAARARAVIRAQIEDALARFDVLLAPTAHHAGPAHRQRPGADHVARRGGARFFNRRSYTTPAGLAGVPALALPCGFTRAGCRSACSSSAGASTRPPLLRAARAYERATEWHARRPPLPD